MNRWTTRCGQSNGCIDIIDRTYGNGQRAIELRTDTQVIEIEPKDWAQLCAAIKAGHLDHIGHQP